MKRVFAIAVTTPRLQESLLERNGLFLNNLQAHSNSTKMSTTTLVNQFLKQQALRKLAMPRAAASNLVRNRAARVAGLNESLPRKELGDFAFDALGLAAVSTVAIGVYTLNEEELSSNDKSRFHEEKPKLHVSLLRGMFLTIDNCIGKSTALATDFREQSLAAYESLPSLQTVAVASGGLAALALSIRQRRNIVDGLYMAKRLYNNTPTGTTKKIAIGTPLVALSVPSVLAAREVLLNSTENDKFHVKLFKFVFLISNQVYYSLELPGNALVEVTKKLLEK